ncbi:hypothetical protein ACFV0O_36335 [Kitasatospora sp. NPDC059577]|uniref:hypothetical protein n=1 Tax=Kitasatospora sp. NPDC059577 TaxID=3346873 RepID=UPI0036C0BBBA
MTSLHPTATDPSLPGPPGDDAGSSPPAAVPGAAAATGPTCSIATVTEGGAVTAGPSEGAVRQGSAYRLDSVPRPRSRDDAYLPAVPAKATTTAPTPTDGDPTAARLRSAFAERLRAARAQGRSIAELAAACRRPVAEVRVLLGEATGDRTAAPTPAAAPVHDPETGTVTVTATGAVDGAEPEIRAGGGLGTTGEVGFVRFPSVSAQPSGPEDGLAASAQRPAHDDLWPPAYRRPSPSRRLRRMHPLTAPDGQGATARETAATGPAGAPLRAASPWTGQPVGAAGTAADRAPFGAGDATALGAGAPPADAPHAEPPHAEPPLGILIGGSPGQPEAVGRPGDRMPVRVVAEPIRVGRGTSLVVLPSWRPAIAVSVSTEQLISATGLGIEQLAGTRLTVLMNPGALHDRELELHGWEPCPAARGRRGGRP